MSENIFVDTYEVTRKVLSDRFKMIRDIFYVSGNIIP